MSKHRESLPMMGKGLLYWLTLMASMKPIIALTAMVMDGARGKISHLIIYQERLRI